MKAKVHCDEVPCNAGVHSEKGASVDWDILTPNRVLIWPVIHKALVRGLKMFLLIQLARGKPSNEKSIAV